MLSDHRISALVKGKAVKTGILCFADGSVFKGTGFGKTGEAVGELCFNTAMSGYQEILTDPSYAGQIVNFTFPHIGNVGVNPEDIEASEVYASGFVVKADIPEPSSWRATNNLKRWAETVGLIGVSGADTRALTEKLRKNGAQNCVIAHRPDGLFDIPALIEKAKNLPGLEGADLASKVSCREKRVLSEKRWDVYNGYAPLKSEDVKSRVIVLDYGAKNNILRCLANLNAEVIVMPAQSSYEEIAAQAPDGIVLSNGPGDPIASAAYAVPVIQKLLNAGYPVFGVCFGHQLLALALGAKTKKMKFGHHGANHPVKNLETQKVEIVSMNHGFTVVRDSLPSDVVETHVSLFDGSNCGIRVKNKPIFSVQYHPEASPGPNDSYYLFETFIQNVESRFAASA